MKRWMLAATLGVTSLGIGCGQSGSNASKPSSGGPSSQVAKANETNNEAPEAAEIVAQFLESVKKGDRDRVAGLLTDLAIESLDKAGIEVAPPGSPQATFELGETRYTDTDKDAAYVELAWTEPAEQGGTPVRSEALFALRKEPKGWRIAGMVLDNGPNQPPEIIDFENIAALAPPGASPASATGPSAPGDTQVAPASGTAALPAGQTALPQTPPSLQQPSFGAPGQVPPATLQQPPAGFAPGAPNQLATPPSLQPGVNR
ncbi:MAG: hypothetical protein ACK56G_09725 [Pirellulaceae bacterium]